MDFTEIKEKLKGMLTYKRYEHSIGVSELSKTLAKLYNYNSDKAYIAGLLHDCARDLSVERLREYAISCNIEIGEIEDFHPILIHAPVGACIAEKEFGIRDSEILQAISSHTVLNENPTLLDKIIYVSDLGEPGRKFDDAEKIREEAKYNLDRAVILAIDVTFKYLIDKKILIHPATFFARNLLIKEVYYGKN